MSRSYRKHPIYKRHFKGAKRMSAKKFRRFKEEVPIRARQFHRRVYNSWDVWDDWYWDFNNSKQFEEYRFIVKELKQNAYDKHLTLEEALELLDRLNDLRYCFFYKMK